MGEGRLGTRTVVQVGLVVRDVASASREWADLLGVDVPEAKLTGPREETGAAYRGEPTEARAKLAFFRTGSVSVELIEPVGGPSTWREFLDEHGEGVHHLAFRVEGMDRALGSLGEMGIDPVQRGEFTGGRYAYVDSAVKLKVLLELLESD